MPLYFRSDTRLPEILGAGFEPRWDYKNIWWLQALRVTEGAQHFHNNLPIDAAGRYCVCLSSKLESAALFPFGENDENSKVSSSYLYAIALPSTTKVNCNAQNQALELAADANTPFLSTDKIIDLHSLQAVQANNILRAIATKKDNFSEEPDISLRAGIHLYGYEAIAHHVPVKNIICAIKITHDEVQFKKIYSPYLFGWVAGGERNFRVMDKVIVNDLFEKQQKVLVGDDKHQELITLDYTDEYNQALAMMKELQNKPLQPTTSPYFGLGGKTF